MTGKNTEIIDIKVIPPLPIEYINMDVIMTKGTNIIKFYGRTKPDPTYWPFSNFYPSSIKINGKIWKTTEHFYQAMKFDDVAIQTAIRLCKTPREAADFGRRTDLPLRKDWENVKLGIMYTALLAKFTQHLYLKELLLSTGDATIIEDSKIDDYWGCGKNGAGKNFLGILLMKVRDNLERYIN